MNRKNLKICICINGRPHEGGMTTTVNEYAKSLRELAHQVDVITIFGRSNFREVKTNLVEKSNQLLRNRPLLTFIGYLVSKLILSFQVFKNFFTCRWDAVLAMDFSVITVAYPLKTFFKIPLLYFYLGEVQELVDQGKIKPQTLIEKYFIAQERKALAKASYILCPVFRAEYIEKEYPNHAPIAFIHGVVNTELCYPDQKIRKQIRHQLKIDDNTFVLLFVGRLAPRKGPLYPLLALEQLIKKDKNYFLLYAGEGPERTVIEAEIKKSQLENKVKLLGVIPHQQIADYHRAADSLVFTPIEKHGMKETLTITCLEAMACGTPVVAFKHCDDIFQDKEDCLLIPQEDVIALTQAIETLKNNQQLKNKITQNALNKIYQFKLTNKDRVGSVIAIINQLKSK